MQSSGRCLHFDGSIGKDLGLVPSFILGPVDTEHMVSEGFSELQLRFIIGLDLANINLVYFNIRCLKKSKR